MGQLARHSAHGQLPLSLRNGNLRNCLRLLFSHNYRNLARGIDSSSAADLSGARPGGFGKMSRPGDAKGKSKKPFKAGGISERFGSALSIDGNKPDAKKFDLGSPISPLHPRHGGAAAATSSSSSSSGSVSARTPTNVTAAAAIATATAKKSDGGGRGSHSGELSGSSGGSPNPRRGHRRSGSGQMIYSGSVTAGGGTGSSASSPATNVLPAGNICPSGKIGKSGIMNQPSTRKDVLGSGGGIYGHGSVIRGSTMGANRSGSGEKTMAGKQPSRNPEEATKAGNDCYKKRQFADALRFFDQAVELCPGNAACRNNRAAALAGLGRLGEAMREYEEAVRLDPSNGKAHYRISSLYLRLGLVEEARQHLLLAGQQTDLTEMQKLQAVERHLGRCADSRRIGDWGSALREADAAIAAGADSSLLIAALRAEALLRLHHLEEADSSLSNAPQHEFQSPCSVQNKFLGMLSSSYFYFVQAQVDMALGRFENAVGSAEKAHKLDPRNVEVSTMLNNVKSVAMTRSMGNELFKSGNFAEACTAYGDGLKHDPVNPVLFCNRAACRSKLGQWERSLADCNEALRIQPKYTKALLRRAASYAKLERWGEAVRDYEVLRNELPGNNEVAEELFHAQVALKLSRGEDVSNMKFGGEVERITDLEQFHAAIALPGVSVVYFMSSSNLQCFQTSPMVDTLCTRNPSLNFLKVDIDESPDVAKAENVRIVPTIKIYKNGARAKEMVCPSQQVLEFSLKHYGGA
ncbi:Inactive TPR repeat-containing thioredoxin TTL3 [Apostasia shenzhenica]|uniref:Inactive TPR repeat-containing thioredoxin TTL3 n=1 Tax=Apostasia shenzhenica TaxID=1088818 RepID=A0A2I0A0G2_9ASPA|nr:Inactive TPR repeat-containing thioredoxin TTL3 [Apostasia shenzhenica]